MNFDKKRGKWMRWIRPFKSTTEEAFYINSGKRLYCHLHRPKGNGKFPGIVLLPGAMDSGDRFDKWRALIRADCIASQGFIAMHFDLSGRGRSEGEEDYWGQRHQEDLRNVLDYLFEYQNVDKENIGVLSLSIGITIAAGALAGYEKNDRVKYLFDWEGPSNRFITTLNDTHPPFKDLPTSNDSFWRTREARNFIGQIRCGYFRYQCERDHVQGAFKGHAIEMLNLANKGCAAWTRCNDNPPNIDYEEDKVGEYHWIPEDEDHMALIIRYIKEIVI